MTATVVDAALAAEAVALGMAAAEDYQAAGASAPGLGFQVALPSVVSALGRPAQARGTTCPTAPPALRPKAHVSAQPTYGSPLVAGQSYGDAVGLLAALEGVAAPTYRYVSVSAPRTPLLGRTKAAFDALLGRR
jgi:hypothetical protein